MKKMLIVYYSWSNGNTERIAKELQSVTGGDLLKIDTAVPYSGSYNDVVRQGQEEVNRGYEPELKPLEKNPADYDVIAVGTPTWWYTMAPAVLTFLHSQNWKGKVVVPFMTNGGWPGHVIRDMKTACPGAEVTCELQVQFDSNGGDKLETPKQKIEKWAQSVKALL
ncbi:flavodoxin [Brotaphodocola sp.]|uniref:flavodoxin n=1 Tax=Brotaphodocola sp. TaxID=3073577 RepID=UPI003D7ECB5C